MALKVVFCGGNGKDRTVEVRRLREQFNRMLQTYVQLSAAAAETAVHTKHTGRAQSAQSACGIEVLCVVFI